MNEISQIREKLTLSVLNCARAASSKFRHDLEMRNNELKEKQEELNK